MTIQDILKATFYKCGARSVSQGWREDQYEPRELTQQQAEQLKKTIEHFLTECKSTIDISTIEFKLQATSYVDISRYNGVGPLLIQIASVRLEYGGSYERTFENYIKKLETVFSATIRFLKWWSKYKIEHINFTYSYADPQTPELVTKYLDHFENNILLKGLLGGEEDILDLRLSLCGRSQFSYRSMKMPVYSSSAEKNTTRNKLAYTFDLLDDSQPQPYDVQFKLTEQRALKMKELAELKKEHQAISGRFAYNFSNQLEETHPDLLFNIFKEVSKHTLEMLEAVKGDDDKDLSLSAGDAFRISFFKRSRIEWLMTVPFLNKYVIAHYDIATLPSLAKQMNELIKDLHDFYVKTGVSTINIDRPMSFKLLDTAYRKTFLKGLTLVAKKINKTDIARAGFFIVQIASYRPEQSNIQSIIIPEPDCTLKNMLDWFKEFNNDLTYTS